MQSETIEIKKSKREVLFGNTKMNDIGRKVWYMYIMHFSWTIVSNKTLCTDHRTEESFYQWIVMYIPWDIARISRTYTHKSFSPSRVTVLYSHSQKYTWAYISSVSRRFKRRLCHSSITPPLQWNLQVKLGQPTRNIRLWRCRFVNNC